MPLPSMLAVKTLRRRIFFSRLVDIDGLGDRGGPRRHFLSLASARQMFPFAATCLSDVDGALNGVGKPPLGSRHPSMRARP